jgi:hypothetical protein
MIEHPEAGGDASFEPTVGEQLRLAQFVNALDKASEQELREISKLMAQQVLVTYPAAMRFLANEAAKNMSGYYWSEQRSEQLLRGLTKSATE